MKILTNKQLDETLKDFIENSPFYYRSTKNFFNDLYNTGCRPSELLTPKNFYLFPDYIQLKTFKTGSLRKIPKSIISAEIETALLFDVEPYDNLTIDQFINEYRKNVKIHPVYCGNKVADLYLFRYNRAKLMHDENKPIGDIVNFFGWNNEAIAQRYINSTLVYDTSITYRR